jgi:RNase H-fold protein (predicted Holliday junction resolvase)
MNKQQQQRYEQRLAEFAQGTELTPGVKSLIWTLACVEIEEETLQHYINENGSCYVVIGTAGDPLSKMRPERNQLKEARMRKQALIHRIELRAKSVDESSESVEAYFG